MRDAEMNDLFSVPVARCKLDIDVKNGNEDKQRSSSSDASTDSE